MSHKDFNPDALRQSFTMIGLDYAAPSPTNPRKSFPEAEMAELVESIKAHGLLQPILVRTWPLSYAQPGPLVTYEIVAGERRWRAAKLAGLTMIEAKHRELSDLEVLEIQIIENLQRADLHPLEEAEGYERIMAAHAYTVEQLGEKIGKSRSYIFARLKLLALDDEARRLFRGGLLNPSTALLVARVPTTALRAKAIKEITALDYNGDVPSVREAQRLLKNRYMLKLADAPFPLGAYNLIPTAGACIECPHRTGNAPDLFDDIDSPDVCTDPDCFVAKKLAHRDREAEIAKATGVTVILGDEAKKIAPNGAETYNTLKGYTNLSAKCHEDPERRTFAEILGDTADAVLLEDTYKNTLIQVLPNNVMAEKMLAAGVKMREEESAKGNAKVEAKLALERATRERVFEHTRGYMEHNAEVFAENCLTGMALIIGEATQRLWERTGEDVTRRIANVWGAEGKNNTERLHAFSATVPMLDIADCWRLLVDILTISGTNVNSEWDLERGGKTLLKMAEQFEIYPPLIRKVVAEELKNKAQAEKPSKKTAKKGKNSPPAEAPYPLNAAQARELTAENAAPGDGANADDDGGSRAGFEEDQATPPAVAGLIETEEKPARAERSAILYTHPDNVGLEWTGRGRKPKWVEAWLAIEGNTLEMLLPAEVKPSSASGEANAKPSEAKPVFALGDRVRIKEGLKGPAGNRRKCCGREGVIEAVLYDGGYEVELDTGPVLVGADEVESVSAAGKCSATVDMFQEGAA